MKSLHQDLHDLQDAVDDLFQALGVDAESGAAIRKPTIIEERPSEPDAKPGRVRAG